MIIWPFRNILPKISKHTFIAPGSQIIGQVEIGSGSSVWHNAIIRGDMDKITIGENTNIQDNSVIHVADNYPTIIGNHVTIGHSAVVHGCTIGNDVLIGMNATVLDGAEIGNGCIIGANALIPQGKKIPPNSMVVGIPGKIVKTLNEEDIANLREHALKYKKLWEENY